MSTTTPDLHRRSIRLREYDYAHAGGYFVTICANGHRCIFGDIHDAEMCLNDVGRIVDEEWRRTSDMRTEIELDSFVVMPNHLHGIVFILEHARRDGGNVVPRAMRGTSHRSLSSLIAGFKAATTRRVNALGMVPSLTVWQRNYYEHVIRSEDDLERIRQYVADSERARQEGRAPLAPTRKGACVGASGARSRSNAQRRSIRAHRGRRASAARPYNR